MIFFLISCSKKNELIPSTIEISSSNEEMENQFIVYSDNGIPQDATDVYTWPTSANFNGEYTEETPPEGNKCFKTTVGTKENYAGWGVFYDDSKDLSSYATGSLSFHVKTPSALKVEIKDNTSNRTKYISNYNWNGSNTWQKIIIPLSDFGADLSNIVSPFMITIENQSSGATFYIDNVYWTKE